MEGTASRMSKNGIIRIDVVEPKQYIVNEIFYSIQGEGPQIGMPAVFIRLTGCNLDCPWCDTKYAMEEGVQMTLEEIVEDVIHYKCPNVVITGGEPMLQPLKDLVLKLSSYRKKIYIETNGTIYDSGLIGFATFIVSPKITQGTIYKGKVLSSYRENLGKWSIHGNFKFVIDTKDDLDDVVKFCDSVKPYKPVYLMPQATDEKEMKDKILWLIDEVKNTYPYFRVTPRIHIWLYGNQRGV